ncbi:MAG: hypothetical protein KA140_00510 [Caldisericia bacterium]|nr:hypothetical protein [Caldisericia bacterium]
MGLLNIGLREQFVDKLKNHIKSGRISNSYLFVGASERLPVETAIGFAKALNCLEVAEDFCDTCQSCRMTNSRTNPDFAIYTPETSKFGIPLVRKIQEDTVSSNYSARYRVNILTAVETMTVEAQNALLKTLEEGRKQCTNILVTTSLEPLLSTIISRSIAIKLPPLSDQKIETTLIENGISDNDAKLEAQYYSGQTRTLLWLKSNPYLAEKVAVLLTKPEGLDPISIVEATSDENQINDIVRFIAELIHRVRLKKTGIQVPEGLFGSIITNLAKLNDLRLNQIETSLNEVERLWKIQIKKQQLLQMKLLSIQK